jgi:hypothetical protein
VNCPLSIKMETIEPHHKNIEIENKNKDKASRDKVSTILFLSGVLANTVSPLACHAKFVVCAHKRTVFLDGNSNFSTQI